MPGPDTHDPIDPMLATIASGAEEPDLGITLFCSGLMITGRVCGERQYFAALLGGDGSIGAEKSRAVDQYAEMAVPHEFPAAPAIHLVDAQVASPHGMVPTRGGFPWRGRLDRVDGFWLRLLTPAERR
jgi:hypothetical protein